MSSEIEFQIKIGLEIHIQPSTATKHSSSLKIFQSSLNLIDPLLQLITKNKISKSIADNEIIPKIGKGRQ